MVTLKTFKEEDMPNKEKDSNGNDDCFRRLDVDDGHELSSSAHVLPATKNSS